MIADSAAHKDADGACSSARRTGQLLLLQDLSKQVQNSANRALLAVDWPPPAAHTGGAATGRVWGCTTGLDAR